MKGTLIAFTLPTGSDKITSSALTKALYAQKTSPHHGKYVYRNIDFLERFSAEYYVCVVELTEEDCEVMGLQIE
ncbi:MAG: hypothetical protein C5S44_05255 [Candidatus Methanocomedens sp.]|nr:MAG: hypothetical protein C5S44_05255 [ANME-2 cluster archaeon]